MIEISADGTDGKAIEGSGKVVSNATGSVEILAKIPDRLGGSEVISLSFRYGQDVEVDNSAI